ncbi:allatotropin-like isoform X3 [Pieris napi]|uniref:allatotropin-like isoform X3 n=1 Tax=Pieris napi TaxID=78633 RepID=UPI001FBB48B8|nr:allatotropin-like isoform X3 [Pieris napi]
MNLKMQVAVLVAVFLCMVDGAPDGRLVRSKQQRPTRGFKNVEMMTARGFGKRAQTRSERFEEVRPTFIPHVKLMVARNYGKRGDEMNEEVYGLDNFWENLEAIQEKEAQDDEKTLESIPMDWFVNEMLNNPDFTRSVVRKFIDLNQDGELSADELLRNVA